LDGGGGGFVTVSCARAGGVIVGYVKSPDLRRNSVSLAAIHSSKNKANKIITHPRTCHCMSPTLSKTLLTLNLQVHPLPVVILWYLPFIPRTPNPNNNIVIDPRARNCKSQARPRTTKRKNEKDTYHQYQHADPSTGDPQQVYRMSINGLKIDGAVAPAWGNRNNENSL
jgi:hypothetical protein